jgi:NADH-quinone oxidoreductase subunit L
MSSTLSASTLLAVPLAPLVGSLLAGVFGTKFGGNWIGRRLAHTSTILGVAIAFILSALTFKEVAFNDARFNETIYEWMVVGGLKMEIGFMVDGLTAMMMVVVTFVSLMVHIYTIGYMEEDEGYNRFFSYISLFTFSMLMLVMSNNLLQLFFGKNVVSISTGFSLRSIYFFHGLISMEGLLFRLIFFSVNLLLWDGLYMV